MTKSVDSLFAPGLLLAIWFVGSAGCVGPQRVVEKAVYACEAKKAYKACAGGCSLDCESARHFERGWRRGYVAVAVGRDGCPPALPPQPYLGKRYQSPAGQQLTSLWFSGYAEGVAAAKRCGHGPQVVINEVGCDGACGQQCITPTPGVLPDARHAVALQAASYSAPIAMPTPVPPVAPNLESQSEQTSPFVEPADEPEIIDTPELEQPTGTFGRVEPRQPPALAPAETVVGSAPKPKRWDVEVAHDESPAAGTPGYEPSPTTQLAFPVNTGDLPAVGARLTSARLPVVDPPTETPVVPTPLTEGSTLTFPAETEDLPPLQAARDQEDESSPAPTVDEPVLSFPAFGEDLPKLPGDVSAEGAETE